MLDTVHFVDINGTVGFCHVSNAAPCNVPVDGWLAAPPTSDAIVRAPSIHAQLQRRSAAWTPVLTWRGTT